MKYKKIIILFLIGLLVFNVACGDSSIKNNIISTGEKEGKNTIKEANYGGEIYLPISNIESLNPLTTQNNSYYQFINLVYEGLFEIDGDLNVKENLVESYEILEDGRVIKIRLLDQVKFHDGESLKAEDVIFTIETIKSAGESNLYGNLLKHGLANYSPINVQRILQVTGSGRDLTISFDRAFSNNLEVLTFPIIPSHIFKNSQDALRQEDYPLVGTGPFKFKSYTKLKNIELEANEDYRKGRPYLDRVVGKILESKEDMARAYETGQVNAIISSGSDWENYEKNDRMELLEFTSSNLEFIGFNFNKNHFKGEEGLALRRAISYAIDRESIVERVYRGQAREVDLPIHPDSWLNSAKAEGQDLNRALREINSLGYKEKTKEGYLANEKGEIISLRLLTNTYNPLRMATAEIVRKNLLDIGIKLEISPNARRDLRTSEEDLRSQWELVEAQIKKGDFDLVLSGWEQSIIPDMGYMFHSNSILTGTNFIGYSNEETDRLLEEAFNQARSREQKKENYSLLNENLRENLPYVNLLYRKKALVIDRKYSGEMSPSFFNNYRGLENLFLIKKE